MSQSPLPSLRLILFSVQTPLYVNTLVKAFESLGQQVLLVVTSPGKKGQSPFVPEGLVARADHDRDILVTRNMDHLPVLLSGLSPDLIFTAGFPFRCSSELLALPHLGCVNAHPSLLPTYRGSSPVFWQLMNNETETGMTLYWMDADFDTGPILLQRKLAIAPDDDIRSLWKKLLELQVSMLPEMLAAAAAGDPGTPQPSTRASSAPPVSLDLLQMDWTRPASYLYNLVRASAFFGARAFIDGQAMLVRQARVVQTELPARPGSLLACTQDGLLVQTGQDALLVTEYLSEDEVVRL